MGPHAVRGAEGWESLDESPPNTTHMYVAQRHMSSVYPMGGYFLRAHARRCAGRVDDPTGQLGGRFGLVGLEEGGRGELRSQFCLYAMRRGDIAGVTGCAEE